MHDKLTESIQSAAYLQWEETGSGSPLEHWRCVEDIACFIEERGLFNEDALTNALNDGGTGYEEIIREIAYRLSFHSGEKTAEENWYLTERLLHKSEWRQMIIQTAEIYAQKKHDPEFFDHIRSERVKERYRNG